MGNPLQRDLLAPFCRLVGLRGSPPGSTTGEDYGVLIEFMSPVMLFLSMARYIHPASGDLALLRVGHCFQQASVDENSLPLDNLRHKRKLVGQAKLSNGVRAWARPYALKRC